MVKIDQSIATIKYLLNKKQRSIDSMSRKMQPTEREKIFIGEETELIKNVGELITAFQAELTKALGKIPPHDDLLERSVLAALLMGTSISQVIGFLHEDHFYSWAHKLIYKSLKGMYASGMPIDLRTIVSNLRKEGILVDVGGASYIAELTLSASSDANVVVHARILVEQAIKRELIIVGGEMMSDGYEDTTDAILLSDKYQNEMKRIAAWIK